MIRQPAGFWRRLAANLLDAIIIGIPLSVISYFITGDLEGDPLTNTLNVLYALIIPVVWSGYTVGKKIMGIRIAKVNGEKLGIGAMLLRTLVAGLVYVLTLGIGIIISAFMVGLRDDKRAIHDFIAGTYVTHDTPQSSKIVSL
ncbi:membrane protein [Bacillus sp. FJAT-27231]|uniref:RDD family protein n=1 Tax=Bacillus sp. FJAT-27231 TaxID=1679168 RepID=UPI000670D553|nr:RDD family protein [Bacillus sp. FJAT-27231]KMY54993.1 membrane protein [Bacillus sp. FJAT-27231]